MKKGRMFLYETTRFKDYIKVKSEIYDIFINAKTSLAISENHFEFTEKGDVYKIVVVFRYSRYFFERKIKLEGLGFDYKGIV